MAERVYESDGVTVVEGGRRKGKLYRAAGRDSDKAQRKVEMSADEKAAFEAEAAQDSAKRADDRAVQAVEAVRVKTLEDEADVDPVIDKLRTASKDEIESFVDAQVTSLATAKVVITKLAVAVAWLAKGRR